MGMFEKFFCVFLFLLTSQAQASVWYVKAKAIPSTGAPMLWRDGTSWANAFTELQTAIDVASSNDEIWVARGIYYPTFYTVVNDPRSATFYINKAVTIYGGFDGTETAFNQRAGLFRETVLSGDIGLQGLRRDNADHVVSVKGFGSKLDGVKITDGNSRLNGGGVFGILTPGSAETDGYGSSFELSNAWVTRNFAAGFGGGMSIMLGAPYVIKNTHFEENYAARGGAIHAQVSSVRVYSSMFTRNVADTRGGAVFLPSIQTAGSIGPRVKFFSSIFHRNFTNGRGGAAFIVGAPLVHGGADWINCTLVENHAASGGGGIFASDGGNTHPLSRIWNSIVWNNTIRGNVVQDLMGPHQTHFSNLTFGGSAGNFNTAFDPEFVNSANGDFRLQATSPLIDRGGNEFGFNDAADVDSDGDYAEPVPYDFSNSGRYVDAPTPNTGAGVGPIVDIGAFEFQ